MKIYLFLNVCCIEYHVKCTRKTNLLQEKKQNMHDKSSCICHLESKSEENARIFDILKSDFVFVNGWSGKETLWDGRIYGNLIIHIVCMLIAICLNKSVVHKIMKSPGRRTSIWRRFTWIYWFFTQLLLWQKLNQKFKYY